LPPENLLGFYDYRHITPAPEYAQNFIFLSHWKPPFWKEFPFIGKRWKDVRFKKYLLKDFEFILNEISKRDYSPEIVYFSGLSLRYLAIAVHASLYFDVPMMVLHMDDWIALEKHELKQLGRKWFNRTCAYLSIAASRSLISTTNSPRLAKKLERLTGKQHYTANNCCSDLMQGHPELDQQPNNPVPIITYAGGLFWTLQGEMLSVIASAIAELNAEGIHMHLHVYTPARFAPIINELKMPNAIYYKGHVGRSKLAEIYLQSDFLLTTVTFRPNDLILFKHSLSTKLSDYLCAGRPVISAGHPDWHLNEYVKQNHCGFAIEVDPDYRRNAIKEELTKIVNSPKHVLSEIGQNNRRLWEKAHDVTVMAQRNRQVLGLGKYVDSE
jgi:hypothetical protein